MGVLSSGIAPSLIHGVEMVIRRLDKSLTLYDDVYREPANPAAPLLGPEFMVLAQIHYKHFDMMDMHHGGDDDDADGYILMLDEDVQNIGGPLKKSDRIVQIDGADFRKDSLYIIEVGRAGHYATSSLWKFFFSKREHK